jgi:phosphoglycerate-specific signal transduction histidine kinase
MPFGWRKWSPAIKAQVAATIDCSDGYAYRLSGLYQPAVPLTLLADLQRALRRQAQLLKSQNQQLQREMQEREQAQKALRLEQQKSEQLLLEYFPQGHCR